MERIARQASWFFGACALLLVLIGAALARRETGTIHFDAPVQRFPAPLEPFSENDLLVTVRNDTRRAVHLLGSGGLCGPDGCIDVWGLPQEVKAGGAVQIRAHYAARWDPGPFALEGIPIYTDSARQPSLVLRVAGEIRPAEQTGVSEPASGGRAAEEGAHHEAFSEKSR